MPISFILPTRDRPQRLKSTLAALATLGDFADVGGAEVIIVDNASQERPILPARLASGLPCTFINLSSNMGAASRNLGAEASDPASQWLILLDDDSYPDDPDFARRLFAQPADVLAVSADIFLPGRAGAPAPRESGGLPEVFIGCGVAIRRDAFLAAGGYDPTFHYYVEEYDLAARLLLAGGRVAFDPLFSVTHAKDARHRNMDLILSRLVRNNGWVAQRYAPTADRPRELREVRTRYRAIAEKERALDGFAQGLIELRRTLRTQSRTPMPQPIWDRFTGLAAARAALQSEFSRKPFRSAAIIDHGKNAWAIARALQELGIALTGEGEDADAQVIGTMSPGPMLDAFNRRTLARTILPKRILLPWTIPGMEPAANTATSAVA